MWKSNWKRETNYTYKKKAILLVNLWAKDVRQSLALGKTIWEGFKDYLQTQWFPIPSLELTFSKMWPELHTLTSSPPAKLNHELSSHMTLLLISEKILVTGIVSLPPISSCQNLTCLSTLSSNAISSTTESERKKVIPKWPMSLPLGPSGDKLSPPQVSAHMYRDQI